MQPGLPLVSDRDPRSPNPTWGSVQEKRSAYAPGEDQPVRYDGIYRIARAYRKPGAQGKLVCRYLFIRADNEPAPWSSEGAHPDPGYCIPARRSRGDF